MIPLLKLGGVLGLIIILLRRKFNLGFVLLVAAVVVAWLFAHPLPALLEDVLKAIEDPLTLRLALIVVLIMLLGELLRVTAGMTQMVQALDDLLPDGRLVLVLWPAFIGLLPMVGGAMFSAPLVQEVGERLHISAERRTFLNYWFRHVWENVLPLYPSFVLGIGLLGVTVQRAVSLFWPMALAAVGSGLALGLASIQRERRVARNHLRENLRLLARSSWPVFLVLLFTLGWGMDMLIALGIVLGLQMLVGRVPLRTLRDVARRLPWTTVLVIVSAMVFRQVLEGAGAVHQVAAALSILPIAPAILAFILPFLAGLFTGLTSAAYSIGFPLVLPLFGAAPLSGGQLAWLWTAGLVGVLLSPMHACLALTREYFKADWGRLYRFLFPAAGSMALMAGLLLLVW